MRILSALQTVLAGTHENSRGLLRWEPALWSALAAVLIATVPAVMGFRVLAYAFLSIAAALLLTAVVGIAVATAARLKDASNA